MELYTLKLTELGCNTDFHFLQQIDGAIKPYHASSENMVDVLNFFAQKGCDHFEKDQGFICDFTANRIKKMITRDFVQFVKDGNYDAEYSMFTGEKDNDNADQE